VWRTWNFSEGDRRYTYMAPGYTHGYWMGGGRTLLGALAVPLAPIVFTLGAVQEPEDCGTWWR